MMSDMKLVRKNDTILKRNDHSRHENGVVNNMPISSGDEG